MHKASERAAAKKPWRKPAGAAKVKKVMHEWGAGELHSGSKRGPVVTRQRQAVAIALSQAREANKGRRK